MKADLLHIPAGTIICLAKVTRSYVTIMQTQADLNKQVLYTHHYPFHV